jgi:hypothetical protein
MTSEKCSFKIGDAVRLRPSVRRLYDVKGPGMARIIGRYSDVEGGVILDRGIEGFRSWNVEDLLKVEPKDQR